MQATARLLGQSTGAALVALVFTRSRLKRHHHGLVHRRGRRGRGLLLSASAAWLPRDDHTGQRAEYRYE